LPLETNWNLIWLKSKNLTNVAKAFQNYIINKKDEIIENQSKKYNNYE